jgi:HK97 family phage prohead protease
MNRAYSVLEVKELDDDKRILTGLATTPSTDRMDDIVEPKGAVFKLPLPLLWQHRHDQPIGNVTRATVKDSGIEVVAQIAKIDEPGTLKDRIDEAWQSIKAGLVRGFSIGFSAIESADIEGSWGRRFTRWEWLELSAVTVPANAEATIQAIKSMDEAVRKGRGIPLIKARAGSLSRGAVELIRR